MRAFVFAGYLGSFAENHFIRRSKSARAAAWWRGGGFGNGTVGHHLAVFSTLSWAVSVISGGCGNCFQLVRGENFCGAGVNGQISGIAKIRILYI